MFKNMHDLQAHHLLQMKGIDELLVCSLTLSPLGEVSPSFQTGLIGHVLRLPLSFSWSCEHNALNTQQLTFHMAKGELE